MAVVIPIVQKKRCLGHWNTWSTVGSLLWYLCHMFKHSVYQTLWVKARITATFSRTVEFTSTESDDLFLGKFLICKERDGRTAYLQQFSNQLFLCKSLYWNLNCISTMKFKARRREGNHISEMWKCSIARSSESKFCL